MMLSCMCRACERLPALPKPLPPPGSLPVADRAPAVPGSLPDAASLGMVRLPISHWVILLSTAGNELQ